jgi:PAS domain S-box-containing protein
LKPGDHLSLLYQTELERRAVLAPFLLQGLAQGQQVVCVLDSEATLDYLRDDLTIRLYLDSGQLRLLDLDAVYTARGVFTPADLVSLLQARMEQALAEGYTALRVCGEMAHKLQELPGARRLLEYEAALNEFLPGSQCLALCLYDQRRFGAAELLDVLRVHPTVIVGAELYDNFYYVPPAKLVGGENVAAIELQHWVSNLERDKQAKTELKTYRERLEELVQDRTDELETAIEQLEREITERAQAERILYDSERQYRLLAENSSDMISRHNLAGDYIFVTPACKVLFGYEPQELVGRSAFDFLHPDDVAKARQGLLSTLHTPHPQSRKYRMRRKDGGYIWCEGLGRVVCDPQSKQAIEVVAVTRDIGAQVQVEERLRQRNRELALLNQASRALNATLDLDQVLVTVLEEVQHALGVVACSVWLADPETGELVCRQSTGPQSEVVRGWRLASGEGIAGWVVHHGESLIVPDTQSDPRHFKNVDQQTGIELRSLLSVPLRVQDNVIGALNTMDTTVNRFQDTDETLLELLAATVAMSIENARLYEQARQDAATRAMLLREVNHRVKNNLTAIIGLLYSARRQVRDADGEACQTVINELVGRVRGLDTVHSLLSASQWSPLRLSNLAAQVVRASLQLLPRHKQVSISVAPSPVLVTPDQAHHLALLFNELATNSAKYALQERDAARIDVHISQNEASTRCVFRDDGPGYPPPVLRMERHGAGLDLVQSIARDNLNGDLSIHNDQGAVSVLQFKTKSLAPA